MQRISSASHISHFLTERNNKIINIYSNASIQPDTTVTKTLLCVNSKYPNKVNLQILNASIIKIKNVFVYQYCSQLFKNYVLISA